MTAKRRAWPLAVSLAVFAAVMALWYLPGMPHFPWRGGLVAAAVLAVTWLECGNLKPLGLSWPWPKRTLGYALLAWLVLEAAMDFLVQPGIVRLTGEATDYSAFAGLAGNTKTTLRYLAGMWLSAALAEELFYRGYVFRMADRFGRPGGLRSLATVIAGALLFAAPHAYQGLSGLLATFAFGIAFGAVFLATRRNLWVVILAHGFVDTLFLILAYAGKLSWYP